MRVRVIAQAAQVASRPAVARRAALGGGSARARRPYDPIGVGRQKVCADPLTISQKNWSGQRPRAVAIDGGDALSIVLVEGYPEGVSGARSGPTFMEPL